MRTFKLILAYDGTAYAGWQSQRSKATVQDTLEAAIARTTGQNVRVRASGRTDAGVHALGQVVAFQAETRLAVDVLQRALNAYLPHDIVVLDLTEAPADFHPTHHAVRKRYCYVIHDGPQRDVFQQRYCWHFAYGTLDADAMDRAAAALRGTHDFSSFESSGARRSSSVRTVFDICVRRNSCPLSLWERVRVRASCEKRVQPFPTAASTPSPPSPIAEGGGIQHEDMPSVQIVGGSVDQGRAGECPWIVVEVEASGFLYNMVRTIVGTLVEVGRGTQSESWPGEVLAAADRRAAGRTAPPQGLFLVNVDYDDVKDEGGGRSGEGGLGGGRLV